MPLPLKLFEISDVVLRDDSIGILKLHRFYVNKSQHKIFGIKKLKGQLHPTCLARVVSSLASVVAIFMAHKNGDNKGEPGHGTCKVC